MSASTCSRILALACLVATAAPEVFAQEADNPTTAPNEAPERAQLSGVWRGFAVEGKGEKPDQGPVKLQLTFSEKTIQGTEFKGDQTIDHGQGEYTLDLATDPRWLDGAKTLMSGRKDVWLGIYKLDGNTLHWCVAKRQRPTTFETVKGQFLMILKRDPNQRAKSTD